MSKNQSQGTLPATESAAAPAAPENASQTIARLEELVAQQAAAALQTQKNLDLLVAAMTQQLANSAAAPAPAPVAAPTVQAILPDRAAMWARDRDKIEATAKRIDEQMAKQEAELLAGSKKYECCIVRVDGNTVKLAGGKPKIVGAESEAHADAKYRQHFGITGFTFPTRLQVRPLTPDALQRVIDQPAAQPAYAAANGPTSGFPISL